MTVDKIKPAEYIFNQMSIIHISFFKYLMYRPEVMTNQTIMNILLTLLHTYVYYIFTHTVWMFKFISKISTSSQVKGFWSALSSQAMLGTEWTKNAWQAKMRSRGNNVFDLVPETDKQKQILKKMNKKRQRNFIVYHLHYKNFRKICQVIFEKYSGQNKCGGIS